MTTFTTALFAAPVAVKNLTVRLAADEAGFIVSAELILIATIGVVALVVGLAEVSYNVNEELEDVGSSVGQINQSYTVSSTRGHKASVFGSQFSDGGDFCDGEYDITCDGFVGNNGN